MLRSFFLSFYYVILLHPDDTPEKHLYRISRRYLPDKHIIKCNQVMHCSLPIRVKTGELSMKSFWKTFLHVT